MNRNIRNLLLFIIPIWIILMAVVAWNAPLSVTASQVDPSPSPTLPPPGMGASPGNILLNLPPDASQADVGSEVYRLICSACHAYDGTGLTDKWRSSWAPEDQNCWQSKCHGYNHPSDGFYLPASPPVVGRIISYRFATAQELHDYILSAMPWQDPGMLSDMEAWATTSHILFLNAYKVPEVLGPENAASFDLRAGDAPEIAQSIYLTAAAVPAQSTLVATGGAPAPKVITVDTPTPTVVPTRAATATATPQEPRKQRSWVWALPIAAAVLLIVFVAARRKRTPGK